MARRKDFCFEEASAPPRFISALFASYGVCHAFFTRLGGVSEGEFASLNFAWAAAKSAIPPGTLRQITPQRRVRSGFRRGMCAVSSSGIRTLYCAFRTPTAASVLQMSRPLPLPTGSLRRKAAFCFPCGQPIAFPCLSPIKKGASAPRCIPAGAGLRRAYRHARLRLQGVREYRRRIL